MTRLQCPQEAAVTRAALTGYWESSLAAHTAACSVCQGIVQASGWMQALAGSTEADLESGLALPDAGLLWWKARLSEKQAKAEKAQDVLDWVEIASVAAVSFSLAGWLAWHISIIQGWMAWFLAGAQLWVAIYSVPSLLPTFLLLILGALCLTALAFAYPILSDE